MKYYRIIVSFMFLHMILLSGLYAQTLNLKDGWNLVGSQVDGATLEVAEDEIVWKYSNENGWSNPTTVNAGEGFWIKTNKTKSLILNGTTSTALLSFPKAGWHLVSPIRASLDVSTLFASSDYSALWMYNGESWNDKSKIGTILAGEGFWVKTGVDGKSLADVQEAVLLGSVDLAGLVDESSTRGIRSDDLPPQIPDDGSVQVYSLDDKDFDKPLLKSAVEIRSDGTYNIENKDFIGDIPPQVSSFIVRVIAEKNGQNYDLSAIASKGKTAKVNPISHAVRMQIISTIKTMFSDDFKMDDNIIALIDQLASAIAAKVEKDVKDGKMTLRQVDFITDKKPQDVGKKLTEEEKLALKEKEDRLKAQLAISNGVDDLALFESELSKLKDKELADKKIDLSKIALDADIAIVAYDFISSFAKMGLSVHDGQGNIVVFTPVSPEDFDKLPGVEFNIASKDGDKDVIVGDDPALRCINLVTDLKNITGDEPWAMKLEDIISYSPIVPYNVIKAMVKNRKNQTKLQDLGNYLKRLKHPINGKPLFDANPVTPMIGLTLVPDTRKSAKKIVGKYTEALIKDSFEWMQYNAFDRAMREDDIELFFNIYESKEDRDKDAFIQRLKDSDEFTHLVKEVAVPLAKTIPLEAKKNTPNLINFQNYTINKKTTVSPKIGFAMMNLLMTTGDFKGGKIKKVRFDQRFGFMNDKAYKDKMIWAVDWEDHDFDADEYLDKDQWMKDLIVGIAKQLTGVEIRVEAAFGLLLNNKKEIMKDFREKIEELKGMGFMDEGDFFGEESMVETLVFGRLISNSGVPIEAKAIKFIPIIENRISHERFSLPDKAVSFAVDSNGIFKDKLNVYNYNIEFGENGEKKDGGEWYRTIDFDLVVVMKDGSEKPLWFRPIFPQDKNDLKEIYVDEFSYDKIDEETDHMIPMDTNFQIFPESSDLYYPFIRTNDKQVVGESLLKYDGDKLSQINLVGKLQGGSVEIFRLSSNWEETDQVWMTGNFNPTNSVNSISIGAKSDEGSMYLLKVTSPQIIDHELLLTVDFVESWDGKFEVGVSLMPAPDSKFGDNYNDFGIPTCWSDEQQKEIELPQRDDGSYPWPEDPDFPKECLEDSL